MSRLGDETDLDDLAERAERGRVFYEMFPGTAVSDRWVDEFEHVDLSGDAPRAHDDTEEAKRPR